MLVYKVPPTSQTQASKRLASLTRWGANWKTVDPWFNFRATKYLVQNGFYSFWDWFDDSKLILSPPSLLEGHWESVEEKYKQ